MRFTETAILLIGLLSSAVFSRATTHYVDYAGGSDSNNGTSTSTPWKRVPGMVGFAGTYSHTSGDVFILKGGVTWPNGVFPLTIANSGSSVSVVDTYTSTNTWYSGESFTLPCLDGEYTAVTGSISSMIYVTGDYVRVKGIEVKRQLIPNTSSFNAFGHGGIRMSPTSSYVTITECWVHDWKAGVSAATPGNTDSDFGGITALSGSFNITAISNVIGPGLAPDGLTGNSGCGAFGVGILSSNRIFGVTEGFNGGATNISFNEFGPFTNSYDSVVHPNVIYHGLGTGGSAWIYGNKIHDSDTRYQTMLLHVGYLGATNTAYYISGNLIYNVTSPVDVDESNIVVTNSGTKAFIYNNTIVRSIGVAAVKRSQTYHISLLECKNNLWISDTPTGNPIGTADSTSAYAPVESLVDVNNVWLATAEATAAGYTLGNLYEGTSETAGLGTNFYDLTFANYDVTGAQRQSSGAWDVGAYVYTEPDGGTAPSTPTGLTGIAGHQTALLTWNAAATADSYRIYKSTDNSTFTLESGAVSTNLAVTALTNGTTYYFKVSALNIYAESALSAAVSLVPRTPPPPSPASGFNRFARRR